MDKIKKGNRTMFLYDKAVQLVAEDATFEQVKATINLLNKTRCDPPVGVWQIRNLLRKIQKYIDKRSNLKQHAKY